MSVARYALALLLTAAAPLAGVAAAQDIAAPPSPESPELTVAETIAALDGMFANMRIRHAAQPSGDEQAFLARMAEQLQRYGAEYRARLDVAAAAGAAKRACLPPPGEVTFQVDALLDKLNTVPEADRAAATLRAPFEALLDQQFPCPAAAP